jgi:hypothetical protein
VHYTLTEAVLPEMMPEHIGEFYVAKAEGTVWFVASNGAVVSLTDLLLNAKPVAPPRHGVDGKDGKSVLGPRGQKGEKGDSIVGATGPKGETIVGPKGDRGEKGDKGDPSTVPGPKGDKGDRGESVVGPHGLKGDRGERGPAGADADNSAIAAMRKEVAEVKLMLQGMLDMNTKAGEYIEFLKAKVAARLAAAK